MVLTSAQLVKRLVALVPPRGLHLTNFHGVFSSHATERPNVMPASTLEQKPTGPVLHEPEDQAPAYRLGHLARQNLGL